VPRSARFLFYATAREAVGRASLEVPVPAAGARLSDLLARLAAEHRSLSAVLPSCRVARNGRYVAARTGRVRPGDEIAIHPPYSGG